MKVKSKHISPNGMKEAYFLLFKIENELKHFLKKNYVDAQSLNLNEIIGIILSYPRIYSQLDKKTLSKLQKIHFVRNKVCHMKLITSNEYGLVLDLHKDLLDKKKAPQL